MDEHDVVKDDIRGVLPVDLKKVLIFLVVDLNRHAMQSVVKFFCYRKEFLVSFDDVPLSLDTELAQKRDHPREDLRDSPPYRRGIDVLDNSAAETFS
jgi:hypothetical protein